MPPIPSAFLETLIALLLPHFTAACADIHDTRREIIETLGAYPTRTRAEMLQAARIIALGMTTLDALAESRTPEISQSLRIRCRSCANSLNRSTIATEKALDRRLACDLPTTNGQAADVQATPAGGGDPIDPRATRAAIAPPVQAQRNQQLWAGAMIDTLRQMGIPTAAARQTHIP
ncbi:MAG TPA: hypothetical protein VGM32_14025 [Rhodopila sp.]